MHLWFLILILGTVISSVVSVLYYMINSVLSHRKSRMSRGTPLNFTAQDATCLITVYKEDTDHLHRAVELLKDQVKEIIIVADGSGDRFRDFAKNHGIRLLSTGTRSGKRASIALGVSQVTTKVVVFMDGDMVPEIGSIKFMLSEYTDRVGGVGGNIFFDTSKGTFASYASQFIERSKETIQRSMKHFGNVMLIDGGFGSYRMDVVGEYIQSDKFKNFRLKGKIPYAGGGDDADLTSYVISKGLLVSKSFDARVHTIPKDSMKAYYKQSVRWSRAGWRNFIGNIKNGTMRKANVFYRIEQTMTYALPIIFLAVILLRGFEFFDIWFRRGFQDAFLNATGLNIIFHGHIHISPYEVIYRLSTTSSAVASLVFAGSAIRRTISDRLKTLAYGSLGAAILFVATIYSMLTPRSTD